MSCHGDILAYVSSSQSYLGISGKSNKLFVPSLPVGTVVALALLADTLPQGPGTEAYSCMAFGEWGEVLSSFCRETN